MQHLLKMFIILEFQRIFISALSCNETKQLHQFLKFIFWIKLYMFRTVRLSIIRSFSLYTQQWYMSYRFADSSQAVSKHVWHITLLCVQWKTPDDRQTNCPKHVESYSKNKFEKLVHLVVIIRIFHHARSPERQIHICNWDENVWRIPSVQVGNSPAPKYSRYFMD